MKYLVEKELGKEEFAKLTLNVNVWKDCVMQ